MRLPLRLICSFLGLIFLVGCPSGCDDGPLIPHLVTITYRQVYNFSEWEIRASDGSIFSTGKIDDGVFMRYRIVSINNSSNPRTFHFDPHKIHASDVDERPVTPVIGLSGALAFDVVASTTFTQRLNVTIKTKGSIGEIGQQIQFLNYDSSEGEHVVMANEDSHATSVPFRNPLRIPGPDAN